MLRFLKVWVLRRGFKGSATPRETQRGVNPRGQRSEEEEEEQVKEEEEEDEDEEGEEAALLSTQDTRIGAHLFLELEPREWQSPQVKVYLGSTALPPALPRWPSAQQHWEQQQLQVLTSAGGKGGSGGPSRGMAPLCCPHPRRGLRSSCSYAGEAASQGGCSPPPGRSHSSAGGIEGHRGAEGWGQDRGPPSQGAAPHGTAPQYLVCTPSISPAPRPPSWGCRAVACGTAGCRRTPCCRRAGGAARQGSVGQGGALPSTPTPRQQDWGTEPTVTPCPKAPSPGVEHDGFTQAPKGGGTPPILPPPSLTPLSLPFTFHFLRALNLRKFFMLMEERLRFAACFLLRGWRDKAVASSLHPLPTPSAHGSRGSPAMLPPPISP